MFSWLRRVCDTRAKGLVLLAFACEQNASKTRCSALSRTKAKQQVFLALVAIASRSRPHVRFRLWSLSRRTSCFACVLLAGKHKRNMLFCSRTAHAMMHKEHQISLVICRCAKSLKRRTFPFLLNGFCTRFLAPMPPVVGPKTTFGLSAMHAGETRTGSVRTP